MSIPDRPIFLPKRPEFRGEESKYDFRNAPTLYNLRDAKFDPNRPLSRLGVSIIDQIDSNPSIDRVVIYGQPGVGKSAVCGDILAEAKRRFALQGITFRSELLTWDHAQKLTVEKFGPRKDWEVKFHEDLQKWHVAPYEWESNWLYFRASSTSPLLCHSNSETERNLQVIEVPAQNGFTGDTLSTAIKNRGITTLFSFARDAKRTRETSGTSGSHTLFVAMFAFPDTQDFAAKQMRPHILSDDVRDEEVIDIMRDPYRCVVVGFEEFEKNKRGAMVKEQLRWAARPEDTESIRNEMIDAYLRLPDVDLKRIENIRLYQTQTLIKPFDRRAALMAGAFLDFMNDCLISFGALPQETFLALNPPKLSERKFYLDPSIIGVGA